MKRIIWICAIMGSCTSQNLCIIKVTGTRESAMSQAPSFVR